MKTLSIELYIKIDGKEKYVTGIDFPPFRVKNKISSNLLYNYCDTLTRAATRTIRKNHPEIIEEGKGGG